LRGRRTQRGFTLLEMLIALTLMSMLGACLYGSMSVAFRGRRAIERVLEPARRSTAAMRMLQTDLESAVGASGLLAGTFLGDDAEDNGEPADFLTFHALARDQAFGDPPSAIVQLEIGLAEDEETGDLLLVRRTTTNLLAPETADVVQETLCRGVRSFDVGYFDGTSWADTWDSTIQGDVLPLAVEVTLVLDRDDDEQDEGQYALTRVFALPCGALPAEGEGGAGLSGGGGLGGGGSGGGGRGTAGGGGG
jgi:general secretion pathway protein J